jgi:hypothetical protein
LSPRLAARFGEHPRDALTMILATVDARTGLPIPTARKWRSILSQPRPENHWAIGLQETGWAGDETAD